MTPYYEQGGIVIYHGDCRDVLIGIPPESVDLLLTDPPYGIEWESNRRQNPFGPIFGDAGSISVPHALEQAVRCLRGRRHMYVFGRFDLSQLPLGGLTELIWDKELPGMGDCDLVWATTHEPIIFGVKANAAQRKGGTGNGPARLRKGSVLRYQRLAGVAVNKHPTEKPVALLRELIESSTHLGETVMDPFMGSGSTMVAAYLESRKAIGIEIEERYCELAARRLSQGPLDALWGSTGVA